MVNQVIEFIVELAQNSNKPLNKQVIAEAVSRKFQLRKSRSVYWGDDFAIRFSTAKTKTFSNTVLGLSTLRKYDHLPFVVCIVRKNLCEFLLANTTFLKKISHSSHRLAVNNVRGSFLGHDIMRTYADYNNSPENFDILFQIHQETPWEDNLQRLVDATNAIQATGQKFSPDLIQRSNILESVRLAQQPQVILDEITADLDRRAANAHDRILELAEIDNVNERGNFIEQVITDDTNRHELGDIYFQEEDVDIILDVKTKIFGKSSNPKGYNIDKLLEALANGRTYYGYYFLGINRERGEISSVTLSCLDSTIIDATRIQFHWAGRNSRGVTQLSGDLDAIFSPQFVPQIDEGQAIAFLKRLIAL